MRVLVVGSLREAVEPQLKRSFQQACFELGAQLARAGHDLLVGSDDLSTADPYVVRGFSSVGGRHIVWIYCPDESPPMFSKERTMYAGRIDFRYRRLRGGVAGRVPQIQAADGVIAIAGSKGTDVVCHIAPALERAVLLIPCFGGAASDLWPELAPHYSRVGRLDESIDELKSGWASGHAELAEKTLHALVSQRVFRRHAILPYLLFLLIELFLLASWTWIFLRPITTEYSGYYLFVGLFAAVVLGTFLRYTTDRTRNPSAVDIVNDLAAALVLGFALLLIYVLGGITINGTAVNLLIPHTTDDYRRVVAVMSALGLVAGFLLEHTSEAVTAWLRGSLPRTRRG